MAGTNTRTGGGAGSSGPRRRADAERSIEAIIDAAQAGLAGDPGLSMAELARTAGVGRVTLYAHFPSREALLGAVLERAVTEAAAAIEAAQPERGSAAEALDRLIRTSWHVLDRHRRLFAVAQHELPAAQMRQHHHRAMVHVERLVERGREEGDFRTDLPTDWLLTTVYSLMHAAADDVNNERLTADRAPEVLVATILPALRSPSDPGR
ncbi:TetR/AcrR family transcriptional regulator [Yinghuangia seranimata]|uniref:TetR/AcrR family transcriptional regulator n=1 Tax=Yinghuangia seranimata TaxID=408067 RepID=UPI00248A95E7|nr:TetR/AcrR family transcriptional regulator [Yinghuangia seranimata]MDI2124604.1 TetR/AcrR family transcriptional regulator [Yinghuangia seranimata]